MRRWRGWSMVELRGSWLEKASKKSDVSVTISPRYPQ